MPRPGQTPQPQYKRSPSMPYGSVGPANAARPGQQPQQRQTQPQQTQGSPIEDFLFGATQRPTEPVTAGAPFGPGPGGPEGVPDTVLRALPLLQRLATDPDAPPQLRDMVRFLVYRAS